MNRFLISSKFEVQHLSEEGAYSDMNINDGAFIGGRCLFEARHLSEEMRYMKTKTKWKSGRLNDEFFSCPISRIS